MREIDEILGVPNSVPQITQAKNALATVKQNYAAIFNDQPDERFSEDFEEIRDSLKGLISEMTDTIQKLSVIAQDSEKASHFSALAQMSTTLLNANKQLLEIYSEKRRYHSKRESNDEKPQVNIQNALFTGTTQSLTAWIREQQEKGN